MNDKVEFSDVKCKKRPHRKTGSLHTETMVRMEAAQLEQTGSEELPVMDWVSARGVRVFTSRAICSRWLVKRS